MRVSQVENLLLPLELIQLAVRLHEDVLSDVFGVFAILGDVLGDAKDLAVILAHQFFEGGCVAVARSVYQRYVGVTSSTPGCSTTGGIC